MAKKVVNVVKLNCPAGKANPAPPIGPALGSKGVNIMAFCKEYNAQTQGKIGQIIPAEITIFDDRSFTFILKTPPTSTLLMKAAGVEQGSGKPPRNIVGKVSLKQVEEIAQTKLPDLNCRGNLQSAIKIIGGTARNMGIEIEGNVEEYVPGGQPDPAAPVEPVASPVEAAA